MNVSVNSQYLTDAPYSPETKEGFLFDDQVQLEQFAQELCHGHAGAYLISGYRGSGKTSFVNRLKEQLQEVVFVEVNISKPVAYPILLKRIIRQLFLQYEAYRARQEQVAGEFMTDFQLLYDRTFNDIVNSSLNSYKTEDKEERQWKLDVQKVTNSILKVMGPLLMFLLSSVALALHATPWLLFGLWLASIIWGAVSALTLTRTKTVTRTEGKDTTRKSLYDDEIAEYHLFDILQKMKTAGLNMVIVFDELDKLEKPDQVKEIVNDIKPMLLSGYASFIVVAGQALYYDLEKSAFQDDTVISTLFARTFHVAFLKNATLKKFCLNLIQNDTDKTSQVANDFFDGLILQSSRIPRRLVNLVRSRLTWADGKAHIGIEETEEKRLRWRSRVLQAATYVIDSDLASRYRGVVQQDFFTAQVFAWLAKMLTYESNSFRKKDIIDNNVYTEVYPPAWLGQFDTIWDALWPALKKEGLLGVQEAQEQEETKYFWIYEAQTATRETAVEQTQEIRLDIPDGINMGDNVTTNLYQKFMPNPENQSRFLAEFGEFEAYLRKLLDESGLPTTGNLAFRHIAEQLVSAHVLDPDWLKSPAVMGLIDIRNRLSHGMTDPDKDLDAIRNADSNLARLWAEVNEQFTYYVVRRHSEDLKVGRTTEGGFDILGEVFNQRLALEVKTYRDNKIDSRAIAESIDKYENFRVSTSQPLFYCLLIFQRRKLNSNQGTRQTFQSRIRQANINEPQHLNLGFIDMSDEEGITFQIEQALSNLIIPPAV